MYPLVTPSLVKTKDAGLRIRIDRELREAFAEACRIQDIPAAQVLREFMREHVSANQALTPEHNGHRQPNGKRGG